ncbi:MAG: uncharacterized protein KVP18_003436 [Porospora cf. gigantea A]|uniref:uncharacterized protein n=1 Tax=Porospora cf. gigantea A TaxID=2853593 RepID=UPI00355A5935|nr:MAG: hypothetical protein KVP18_003436 [Porospora cf. gigantea A]
MRLIWGLATLACGAGDERLTFYPVSEDTTLVHYAYTSSELPDALLDLMEASHFEAFDASLARGLRAQVPQLPMRPRGLFVAATGDGHWPMLTHGLSGLLCGSFSTLARPMWVSHRQSDHAVHSRTHRYRGGCSWSQGQHNRAVHIRKRLHGEPHATGEIAPL